MDVQDSKKAHLLVDFPWQEVSFHLDDEGNFQVTKELHEVWNKYGFFVVKNLFSKTTMTSLEACTKDSNIQVRGCLISPFGVFTFYRKKSVKRMSMAGVLSSS